jgi:dCMP deaminase
LYASDGPLQSVIFIAAGAMMLVTPTNQVGLHTGRTRYRVECQTCKLIIHTGTTSATALVKWHLCKDHDWDGAPATIVAEVAVPPADAVVGHMTEESPSPMHAAVPSNGSFVELELTTKNLHDYPLDPPRARDVGIVGPGPGPKAIRYFSPEAPLVITAAPASVWVKSKTRPSWGEFHMMDAYHAAIRGSCLRKRVGAVIIDPNNRLVSGGFNGAASKQPSCLEVGCDVQIVNGRESCVRTLHAESNALDYAGRDARGCALFTTVIPCRPCAMRIIQAGIAAVYYSEYYESQGTKATKALLEGAGVKLMQLVLPVNELTIALRRAVGEIE